MTFIEFVDKHANGCGALALLATVFIFYAVMAFIERDR